MKISIFIFFASCYFLFGQVTFTEVMYDPATNEFHDEYIEIYNLSEKAVNLTGWQLSDSLSLDNLNDAGSGLELGPRQYAVILDGSYFGESETYEGIIPDSSLIITIADKGFGRSGLTNSESRTLTLIDSMGNMVDVYRYAIGNTPGHSNEKVFLSGGNNEENWKQSFILGGTPGQRNSVSPFPSDLALPPAALSWRPSANLTIDQKIHFNLEIENAGSFVFEGDVNISVFSDNNDDSLFNGSDLSILSEKYSFNLQPGESFPVLFEHTFVTPAVYRLIAKIESDLDNNELNNTSVANLTILDNSESLHINEIKFLANTGEPEWLEIFNNGSRAVSLEGWGIADQRDTAHVDSAFTLFPGQFKVIASDKGLDSLYQIEDSLILVIKNLPTFNNASDIIYLLNPAGGWLEQVPYDQSWLEGQEKNNPSLERINVLFDSRLSRNWGPSVDSKLATPGRKNSLLTDISENSKSALDVSPNPFSPDNDGFEDYSVITLSIPASTARVKIQIFDILGRKIRTLRDNAFSGSENNIVWDGRDDKGRFVRMGIYIIFSQILNDREGIIRENKTTVVVAGKL